jgi:hypothetical protein
MEEDPEVMMERTSTTETMSSKLKVQEKKREDEKSTEITKSGEDIRKRGGQ